MAANNQPLAATGSVLNGTATITLADGRALGVPWRPGQSYTFTGNTDTGPGTGRGQVSADGRFFVFVVTDALGKSFGLIGGDPTLAANLPRTGVAAHVVNNVITPGGLPFANDSVANDAALKAAASTSKLLSVYSERLGPGAIPGVPADQRAVSMQATVSIAGTGATQKSYHGVFLGTYFNDSTNGSVANAGAHSATFRLGGDQLVGRNTSSQSTMDTGAGNAIYGPTGEYMVHVPERIDNNVVGNVATATRTPQAAFHQPYNDLSGSAYYTITASVKDATPTVGTRTTQTLFGYSGGVVEVRDNTGVFSTRLIQTRGQSAEGVRIQTDATTNRALARIQIGNWTTPGAETNPTAIFELGSTADTHVSTSAFIDDRTYAMRDQVADNLPRSRVTPDTGQAEINIGSRTFLSSYNTASVDSLFTNAGVTACTCEFLTWGWWSGDIRYDNAGFRQGERDRLNLATYVAGKLSIAAQIPNMGSATYTGHMVGNVVNGANSYVQAGSFSHTWNFATQTGTLALGFDGRNFTGTSSAVNASGGRDFTGSFTSPAVGADVRSGSLAGSFFSSPTDAVKGQAGSFNITNNHNSYKAGGIFAGQRESNPPAQ